MPTEAVQEKIIEALRSHRGNAISMDELVKELADENRVQPVAVRAAVLPLISVNQVEFTDDRKLRLTAE